MKRNAVFLVFIFIPILLLAAALRLYAIDLIDFRFDEASAVRFALAIARGEWLSALPFTGSVANHPPVYAYALAPAAALAPDVLAVAVYRVWLDVLAIALCMGVCLRLFNPRVAVIAGLMFACAPWAVLLSRNLGVVVMPLFSTLLLFGLLEAAVRRNPWGWAIAGWGLALCVGSHLTGVYVMPVVLIALLLGRRSLRPAPVLLGVLPCAVLALVYLQYDAARDFANLRALLSASGGEPVWNLDAMWRALWLTGGAHIADLTDGAFAQWQAQTPDGFGLVDTVQMILVVLALGGVPVESRQSKVDSRKSKVDFRESTFDFRLSLTLLLAWCVVPVALQLRHSQPVQMHYLLPVYPAPFIMVGLAVDGVVAWLKRARPGFVPTLVLAAVGAIVCLILVWQALSVVRFADFVERHDTSVGGYGLPVRNARAVALLARDAVCAAADCAGPQDTIVVAPGGDPQVDEQATILDVLLASTPHRFANSAAGLILRPGVTQYVFTPGSDLALERIASRVSATKFITSALPARSGSRVEYTYVRREADGLGWGDIEGLALAPAARWNTGAELAGYRADIGRGGDVLYAETLLQVTQAPRAGADYHWFNHVLSGDAKVAQLDGGGVHPANWRSGDGLWQWFDVLLPPAVSVGTLSLRIGSYEYPSLNGIPVTLPTGETSDGVVLPVRRWR